MEQQKKTEELLKQRLKEKGLKVTHQRILVLSVLEQNSGRHMTAEDIYELVSQDYPEIGLGYGIPYAAAFVGYAACGQDQSG